MSPRYGRRAADGVNNTAVTALKIGIVDSHPGTATQGWAEDGERARIHRRPSACCYRAFGPSHLGRLESYSVPQRSRCATGYGHIEVNDCAASRLDISCAGRTGSGTLNVEGAFEGGSTKPAQDSACPIVHHFDSGEGQGAASEVCQMKLVCELAFPADRHHRRLLRYMQLEGLADGSRFDGLVITCCPLAGRAGNCD